MPLSHCSPRARRRQADRRGPRGGLDIKGSGQAGGAISRIGWGRMREALLIKSNASRTSSASAREEPPIVDTLFILQTTCHCRLFLSGWRIPRVLSVVAGGLGWSRSLREAVSRCEHARKTDRAGHDTGILRLFAAGRVAFGRWDDLVENGRLW